MNRSNGLILAFAAAVLTACASGGGAAAPGDAADTGNRPRDNSFTTSAGVHLAQAATSQGATAEEHYAAALTDALDAIGQDPENPKAYLLAGQAAVGVEDWVQADTMFVRALELYPGYADQIAAEREQGWVNAYNAGAETLNEGELEAALEYFEGADLLYTDRPEARIALGSLHSRLGNTMEAAEAYAGALEILDGPPPEAFTEEQAAQWVADRQTAAFNAAQLLAQAGEPARAAEVLGGYLEKHGETLDAEAQMRALTAQAGFLAQSGDAEAAEALYEEVLSRSGLTSAEYFQIGIGFFNTGDFARAAEAFEMAAELNPYSRDALLNLVQSLYSQAMELEEMEETQTRNQELVTIYDRILETADQVREFDPLNRNLLSFMLRAYRGKADLASQSEAQALNRETQRLYQVYQEQPYAVDQISLSLQGENQAEISGVLSNLSGTAGAQVRLRFELVDRDGNTLNTATATVAAPAQGQTAEFSTVIDMGTGDFAGWRYELEQ